MGGSESKEELIISQAGNSGGTTATSYGHSLWEIIGVVVACFIVVAIVGCLWWIVKNYVKKSIRREIQRSRVELV